MGRSGVKPKKHRQTVAPAAGREKAPAPPIALQPLLEEASDNPCDGDTLQRLQRKSLMRLTPGIVHRMNNVLAVFSSHSQWQAARLMRKANTGRRHSAVERELAGLDKSIQSGKQAMTLVSELATVSDAGEHALKLEDLESSTGPICLGSLVRSLADILLCESGSKRYPLQLDLGLQIYSSLARGPLVLILTMLVEQVLGEIPQDLNGSITISVRSPSKERRSAIELCVGFQPAPGQLPFPIAAKQVDRDLLSLFAKLDITLSRPAQNAEYRVLLPGTRPFHG